MCSRNGNFKIAIEDLIVINAGFDNFQFTVNADRFPHSLQHCRHVRMQRRLGILIRDL